MPATSWTERSVTGLGWQEGVQNVGLVASGDFFVDPLMEGSSFVAIPGPDSWTKPSVTATSYAEGSVASTAWTEVTG